MNAVLVPIYATHASENVSGNVPLDVLANAVIVPIIALSIVILVVIKFA